MIERQLLVTNNTAALPVIIGNQVQTLNSPAAVMTEFSKCVSNHWVFDPGKVWNMTMSKSEDLPTK